MHGNDVLYWVVLTAFWGPLALIGVAILTACYFAFRAWRAWRVRRRIKQ